MSDASDILEDPTETLRLALNHEETQQFRVHMFMCLHDHILAGGALPEQWRGAGTAVGHMVDDERVNLGHFRFKMSMANTREEESAYLGNAQATADALRAVTGEG